MKNIAPALIVVAAIATVLAIISRLTGNPFADLGPRTLSVFAGLALLFVIALQGQK